MVDFFAIRCIRMFSFFMRQPPFGLLGDTALKTKFSVKFFHKKSKFTKSALGDGLGRPRRAGIPRQKERGDFSLSLLR